MAECCLPRTAKLKGSIADVGLVLVLGLGNNVMREQCIKLLRHTLYMRVDVNCPQRRWHSKHIVQKSCNSLLIFKQFSLKDWLLSQCQAVPLLSAAGNEHMGRSDLESF